MKTKRGPYDGPGECFMDFHDWSPGQPTLIGRVDAPEGSSRYLRLQAGHIIAMDRQPWRVLDVGEYGDFRWPDRFEEAWHDHLELWEHSRNLTHSLKDPQVGIPERSSFYKRPVIFTLRNETISRAPEKKWCTSASHDWEVLPMHYLICHSCGELPPCHDVDIHWSEEQSRTRKNGTSSLIIPPDCCMGCAEHINPRMRTIRFPGPNLWYPDLGNDSAVFHARSTCSDKVAKYRTQWHAEYPAPRRQIFSTWDRRNANFQTSQLPQALFHLKTDTTEVSNRNQGDSIQRSYSTSDHPPVEEILVPAQGHPFKFEQAPYPLSRKFNSSPFNGDAESLLRRTDKAKSSEETKTEMTTKNPVGSLTDSSSRRDAEKTARAIEELTAAVRNIANCLNFPPPGTEY
ncbi:hypothetical protein ACFQ71_41205 [Streptomyces sp. NPDC056534]|uniref:hypothetical protein n=1 Tax=Streptomyces sp. NPDC056534 TaxID=3345857 RepID=UPI0036B92ABA